MNNITVTKQQLISEFNEAQQGFIDSLNKGMGYAFRMGEILLKLKAITPHGEFENVLKTDINVRFGERHARRLMRIAENKELILGLSDGNPLTIPEMDKIVAESRKTLPKTTESRPEPKSVTIDADDDAILDKVMINDTLGKDGEEIIEGEFEEVRCTPTKPETEHKPASTTESVDDKQEEQTSEEYTELDHLRDTIDELQSELKEIAADNERMRFIFEDDNHVAAAIREIDRLKSLNDALENRLQGHLNSYQNERSELIRTLNHWKRRAEKAEKALEVANAK